MPPTMTTNRRYPPWPRHVVPCGYFPFLGLVVPGPPVGAAGAAILTVPDAVAADEIRSAPVAVADDGQRR